MRRRIGRAAVWTTALTMLLMCGCGGGGGGQPGAGDDYGAGGGAGRRIGTAMLKYVGDELASAAIGGAAGIAMDAALEAIFGNDTDRIEAGMAECNRKLDLVLDKLDELSDQLDNALAAIEKSRDDIEALNQELAIKEPIDIIQSDYRNLEQMSRWASDDDPRNDPRPRDAQELADTIRSTAKHDIPLQLDRMHTGIVGGTGSGRGALREWNDRIRTSVRDGKDLYSAYLTLENYFTELLIIQTKGLLLIANAFEIDDDDTARYVGTAQSYRDEVFYPHTEQQLKLFIELAEGLIAMQTEPNRKTFLIHPDIPTIYSRIDWIAAQVAEYWTARFNGPKYNYGLHVHVWMDGNKVRPRSSGYREDLPCRVYVGPLSAWDRVALDQAWGGTQHRRYETQKYVDLMLLDDDPRVAGFDWATDVKVYSYSRADFTGTKEVHIQHDLVATSDWVRQAQCKYYDTDFNEVSANTEGAKPHVTVVVDYRILEVPVRWQVNSDETSTSASGWTVTRQYPQNQAVNETWCGLKGTPANTNSAPGSFSLRLDCVDDFATAYESKRVRVEFQASITKRTDCYDNGDQLVWFKYGYAQRLTADRWTTYAGNVDVTRNQRFKPGMKIQVRSDGKTQTYYGSSGTAKPFEYEIRVRNLRLYAP